MRNICYWLCTGIPYVVLLCFKHSVGQEDLKSLHCELHPVCDKWFPLGVQLQVPIESLRSIQRENLPMTERLLEMLTVWLKFTNPPPTWNILTEALESPPVGERLLAQHVRNKYCPQVTHATVDEAEAFPPLQETDSKPKSNVLDINLSATILTV